MKPRLSIAPALNEAAAHNPGPTSLSGSASPLPAGGVGLTITTWARALIAAGARARAFLAVVVKFFVGDGNVVEIVPVCTVCEGACANVLPDLPTATPCSGRKWEGQCCDCGGELVTLTQRNERGGCPRSRLHLVANKREKPYLQLVKEIPTTVR